MKLGTVVLLPLLLALLLALAACEGSPVVVNEIVLPDASSEAHEGLLGQDAAPDVAPTRDARADASDPPDGAEGGAEASVDAGGDVLDDAELDAGDGRASTYCDDAGRCFEPDGSWCTNGAMYGCTPDPSGSPNCGSWQLSAYNCAAAPPGCSQSAWGFYCCASVCQ